MEQVRNRIRNSLQRWVGAPGWTKGWLVHWVRDVEFWWFLLLRLFWMKNLKHQTVIQEDEIRSGSWHIPMTTWSTRDWSSYIGYVYNFIEVRGSSFHVFLIPIPDLNVRIEEDTFLVLCMLDKWWDNVSVQVGIRSIGTDRTGTWIEISPTRIFKISHTSWEFPFLLLLRRSAKKFSEDREHAVIKLHSRESGWAIIGKGTIAMLEACLTLPFLLVFHEFSREFASP